MTRKFLFPLLLLVMLGVSAVVHAENVPVLNLSVDRGLPITLSAPAASVFIANPDVADIQVMSPTSVMVFGKKTGQTTLLATDSKGHPLLYRTVIVEQDLTDLRRELLAAIPGSKITVATLPDAIVLTGETRDPVAVQDARKIASRYISSTGTIINRIQVVGSNQIMIRVRFAEVSRTVNNTFGIDWNSIATYGGFAFGIASGNAIARDATTGGILRPNNSALTEPNDIIALTHTGKRTNINNLIDALAQDGLVTILAEPNLTAMSGETATFLAGGEIPVPIPQTSSGSNTTITVQWKPYGISLEFTPTLISENRINLHIKPEVSQLTDIGSITTDGITIRGLTSRKAETTVELASGQSFAIAGLLDNSQSQTVDKYPILGDMPIIGALFRSTKFQNGQTELIVVITPYIVKPAENGQALALPMDGFSPPSEAEALVGLRNSSGDPNARPTSGAPIATPAMPVTGVVTPPAITSSPDAALTPAAASTNLVANNRTDEKADNNRTPAADEPPPPMAAPVAPVSTHAGPIIARPNPPSGPSGFILE